MPKTQELPPAVAEMMRDELERPPGSFGEFFVHDKNEPPPPPAPPPLEIPRPDWHQEAVERAQREQAEERERAEREEAEAREQSEREAAELEHAAALAPTPAPKRRRLSVTLTKGDDPW